MMSSLLQRLCSLSTIVGLNCLPISLNAAQITNNTLELNRYSNYESDLIAQETSTNDQVVGFRVIGHSNLNQIVIPVDSYFGECPGRKVYPIKAMFTSTNTSTAPGRRVIVRNVSLGIYNDPLPYTDREYDSDRVSEITKISIGVKHRGRYFVVLEGLNTFEYEIKEGERVMERGSFTAMVKESVRYVQRNGVWEERKYCASNVPLHECKYEDIKIKRTCRCP